jgi:hypothetical protein
MPVGALLGGLLGGVLGSRAAIWVMTCALLAAGLVLLASPIRGLREFPGHPGNPGPGREPDREPGPACADPA